MNEFPNLVDYNFVKPILELVRSATSEYGLSMTQVFSAVRKGAIQKFLAERKLAALNIDAETAEVMWIYEQTLDPYGVDPDLPEELQQVGREYFARAPGSDIWVWFGDLSDATRSALWEKHRHELAFPAGLDMPASNSHGDEGEREEKLAALIELLRHSS